MKKPKLCLRALGNKHKGFILPRSPFFSFSYRLNRGASKRSVRDLETTRTRRRVDSVASNMCIARTVTYDCNHKKIIETSCEYWSLPVAGAFRACKTSTSTEHVRQRVRSNGEHEQGLGRARLESHVSEPLRGREGWAESGWISGRRLRLSAQTFPFLSQREWKRKWHPPANWEIGMVRQVVVQHDPPAPTTYLKVPETAPHVRNKALNLLDKARAPSPLRRLLMPPWERRHVLRSALDADELFFETVEAAPKISVSRGPTAAAPDGAKKETAPVDVMGQAAKKSAFRTMSMKHKAEKEQGHQPHSTKPPLSASSAPTRRTALLYPCRSLSPSARRCPSARSGSMKFPESQFVESLPRSRNPCYGLRHKRGPRRHRKRLSPPPSPTSHFSTHSHRRPRELSLSTFGHFVWRA
ncbi:unnamed protein product [Parascedosporium putredinis]|uniref:Uncharacterized protein n=1 Tax=Parascedosporium putredinis TaxID=1442378 RepID=A0A9P1H693_9PEZI|nr:unnamed protein product [Parascedosporium putredinis]CAI7997809.1 unnamed protein product [Parascedosporium putredinis]